MADYVPNMLRCAKCNFELERLTMNANTGAVGIGTNEPGRCPNGCGPLWRVTWEQEAQYLGKRMNEWADRAIAAEKRLAGPLATTDTTPAGWSQLLIRGIVIASKYGQAGLSELQEMARRVNAADGVLGTAKEDQRG